MRGRARCQYYPRTKKTHRYSRVSTPVPQVPNVLRTLTVVKELMKLMLKTSPAKRPTASQLMSHPLLHEYRQGCKEAAGKGEMRGKKSGETGESEESKGTQLLKMTTLVFNKPLVKPDMEKLRKDPIAKKIEERDTISKKTTDISPLDTEDGNIGAEDTEILDEGGIGNALKKYSSNNKVLEVNKRK
eukprot:TRINITY_DN1565_c0_g1_i10.p2 TRINITY_DN1565_c0_g1~~TRINITY_DN1565_c0_g1_i10.p2  ORF type:complete len:187 (+),score=45.47 TRINITY_DN1565_c0_g1_i10:503-1063(+)